MYVDDPEAHYWATVRAKLEEVVNSDKDWCLEHNQAACVAKIMKDEFSDSDHFAGQKVDDIIMAHADEINEAENLA